MGQWSDSSAMVLAPSGSAPRETTRLAGTGTTEATNTTKLAVGCMATLMVGPDAAIRVNFGTATAPGCAATDLAIAAGQRFDWTVTPADCFVSIEAEDGSSAYEAWVWTSSPSL